MGYVRLPLNIASVLLVAATFLTAQCKEYWQFLLCQGIAIGVRRVSPSRAAMLLRTNCQRDRRTVTGCVWDDLRCLDGPPRALVQAQAWACVRGDGLGLERRRHDISHYH